MTTQVIAVVIALIGAIGGIAAAVVAKTGGDDPGNETGNETGSVTPAPGLPVTESHPVAPTSAVQVSASGKALPPVFRRGPLTMSARWAYDLDSTPPGWNPTDGAWIEGQDVGFYMGPEGPVLSARSDNRRVAVLPPASAYSYQDCAHTAHVQADIAPPMGRDLDRGRAVCVTTSEDREALLVVDSRNDQELKVMLTVWG